MTGCGSIHVQVLKTELWYRVVVPLLNRALDVVFYSFGILGALIDLAVCSDSRYAADAKPAEPSPTFANPSTFRALVEAGTPEK
jgi:hypothetical protein